MDVIFSINFLFNKTFRRLYQGLVHLTRNSGDKDDSVIPRRILISKNMDSSLSSLDEDKPYFPGTPRYLPSCRLEIHPVLQHIVAKSDDIDKDIFIENTLGIDLAYLICYGAHVDFSPQQLYGASDKFNTGIIKQKYCQFRQDLYSQQTTLVRPSEKSDIPKVHESDALYDELSEMLSNE